MYIYLPLRHKYYRILSSVVVVLRALILVVMLKVGYPQQNKEETKPLETTKTRTLNNTLNIETLKNTLCGLSGICATELQIRPARYVSYTLLIHAHLHTHTHTDSFIILFVFCVCVCVHEREREFFPLRFWSWCFLLLRNTPHILLDRGRGGEATKTRLTAVVEFQSDEELVAGATK